MVQSRFWLSTHALYERAHEEKKKLLQKNPGKIYQIRKGRDGEKEVFRVVERLKRNEAEVVLENKNPTGYTARPSKRQRRERAIANLLQ